MKYKAIVADVDGTIITPGEYPPSYPSSRLKTAVAKAYKRGVVFTLASARSLPGVENLVTGLNIQVPLILDNGAKIYDYQKKEYLWEANLSQKISHDIISFLSKDKTLKIIVNEDNKRLDDIKKISKWLISKIVVLDVTPEKAEELYQYLRKNPAIHVTKSISSLNPVKESIHVTDALATKQVALLKLSKILKISPQEIIGIGDSYNDFSFLMACGLRVAMENATADIKSIADYIAPSFDKDGVAYVIEKFILS